MHILDIFRYFAAFVPKEALMRVFNNEDGQDYHEIKTELLSASDELRIPQIKDFIFGIDASSVQQRITSVKGMYLFVDYGNATSYIDRTDVKTDRQHISLTVAIPTADNADQLATPPGREAAQLLKGIDQDNCLSVIKIIRDQMREDDYKYGVNWLPSDASTLQPFAAKELANSFGWSLDVNIEAVDKL